MVLAVALAALLAKVFIAAVTYGTNDISHWHDFVLGVRAAGPIGVYGIDFTPVNGYNASFYNHPPLMGDVLVVVSWLDSIGIPWKLTIRTLAALADVGSALLVFELLRTRRPGGQAITAGILVAASPVLLTVSGFHGNTDPVFTMLVLLTLMLLVDRKWPVAGGVAIVLAMGIKIVPVVVVPSLLIWAWRAGRPVFVRFAGAAAVTLVVTWLPALLMEPGRVLSHVWGYQGSTLSQWGFSQIGHWLGDPAWLPIYAVSGKWVVILCALAPAVAVWRVPSRLPVALAVSLAGFLALSPAFGVQYLVWAMSVLYLTDLGLATAYNLAAGAALVAIYLAWTYRPEAVPWIQARAAPFTPGQTLVLFGVWLVLCAAVARGIRILSSGAPASAPRPRSGHRNGVGNAVVRGVVAGDGGA